MGLQFCFRKVKNISLNHDWLLIGLDSVNRIKVIFIKIEMIENQQAQNWILIFLRKLEYYRHRNEPVLQSAP